MTSPVGSAIFFPLRLTSPSKLSNPAKILSKVVLPEPNGARTDTKEPTFSSNLICKLISSRMICRVPASW